MTYFSSKIRKTLITYRNCMIALPLIAASLVLSSCTANTEDNAGSTDTTATLESQIKGNLPNVEGYTTTIALGGATELEVLYSYPNSVTSKETLKDTIEHYLNQRLARDVVGDASATVTVDPSGNYHAQLRGNAKNISDYQPQIIQFLENGKLAAKAVVQLKQDKLWDDKEWRLFLPLGLSIINQRSVQLLHFPPDYSLPDQDYLDSKTSQRWEKLLELNSVPAEEVTLYESILDVAPIAAPASAGSTLSDTYSYFEPYVVDMLPLLLNIDDASTPALPIVAYGGPVRSWVKDHYKLSTFGVNSFDTVQIADQVQAPILGANHPSYIWYAKQNGRAAAMKVMQQDLISACWQAKMGNSLGSDGNKTLAQCSSYWAAKPMTICINMEIQAYDKSDTEAKKACETNTPTTATLANQRIDSPA